MVIKGLKIPKKENVTVVFSYPDNHILPNLVYRYNFHRLFHTLTNNQPHRFLHTYLRTSHPCSWCRLRKFSNIRFHKSYCTFSRSGHRICRLDTLPHTPPCVGDIPPDSHHRFCYSGLRGSPSYNHVYTIQWKYHRFVGYSLHCIRRNS